MKRRRMNPGGKSLLVLAGLAAVAVVALKPKGGPPTLAQMTMAPVNQSGGIPTWAAGGYSREPSANVPFGYTAQWLSEG